VMSSNYVHLAAKFEQAVKDMYPDLPEEKAIDIAWDAAIDADIAAEAFATKGKK
jgi:hypothetical protein